MNIICVSENQKIQANKTSNELAPTHAAGAVFTLDCLRLFKIFKFVLSRVP